MSIALDEDLLEQFDQLREQQQAGNRSEAVRDLIRAKLVEQHWRGNQEVVGTITLVYDHHVRELSRELTQRQHDSQAEVLASLHVHLDHSHCLEAIVVKGRARLVSELADQLIRTRGVLHGQLAATSKGDDI